MNAEETGATVVTANNGGNRTGELPPGSELMEVAFVLARSADQTIVWEPSVPLPRHAILVPRETQSAGTVPADHLQILTVSSEDANESERLAQIVRWAEAEPTDETSCQVMTVQGAQVVWLGRRFAVLAPKERLSRLRSALIEAACFDSELREVERHVNGSWPDWEQDLPLAFDFHDRAIRRRGLLAERFQQVLMIRSRLSRLAPAIHAPHLYPPTLASQVSERLRDRMRLGHRHETLSQQLEVYERVYELCAQKSSDYMLARSSQTLEWVIIVLLIMQLMLSGFELLTSTGS